MNLLGLLSIFVFFLVNFPLDAQLNIANGSAALWHKRYNQVTYAATHNGQSHIESSVQNQSMPLKEQLEAGIRATKIHVWNDLDEQANIVQPFACHGVTHELFSQAYLDKVIEKVPRLFRSWAQGILQQMEPINEIVRDACHAAYGSGEKPGVIQFRHCIFDPARRSLTSLLSDVKQFIIRHPQEVITLILEDHTNNLSSLAACFHAAGLEPYLHTQDITKPWPTLGSMISSGKKLVVFVHGQPHLPYHQYPNLHYIWDYAWDTEWDFRDSSDLKKGTNDSMPKRGINAFNQRHKEPKNKVFMINHFVTPTTGGSKKEAHKVNKKNFLKERIDRHADQAGHHPNIIQVDFFECPHHDVIELAHELNHGKS